MDFLKSFKPEIQQFLENNLANKGTDIILYINQFNVFESTNINNEATANCELDIDFYLTDGFDIYKITNIHKTENTVGNKPNKLFEITIANAFQECFNDFSNIDITNKNKFIKYNNLSDIVQIKDTAHYNFTIFHQKINDGIYTSFDDLKNNQAKVTKGYTLTSLPRIHQLWNDTYDLNINFTDKRNIIKQKNICAVVVNHKIFILFQNEFFELHINNNKMYFFAYDNINNNGAIIGSAIGGFVVGGIVSEVQLKKAKNKKVKYFVNPTNGKIKDAFVVEEVN